MNLEKPKAEVTHRTQRMPTTIKLSVTSKRVKTLLVARKVSLINPGQLSLQLQITKMAEQGRRLCTLQEFLTSERTLTNL
jgi:hypothetical protein